ncbi:unnamed protein product (macronuclear) [Paramecium tetraurelia]|uniref:Uncharacterized protein n=1 Tax=Paramecium tetraurelia TaxID=5888 RepID=A0E807_PARTE|nr:uncharacterized protein GSPATT00024152001 [Paramecium tetraurelia]CAK91424.1 unnamed protein product [Paramecium tetraurelia]|eukprot:XP_001458821.1 hypothetical protein (macronuclear) [Paramecium tetraurelia strain d4-2]
MYQQRFAASNKMQQKSLQEYDIKPVKNPTNQGRQNIQQVQQIYNLQQRNTSGMQNEDGQKGFQIKVFQNSTKSNLDSRSSSQQSKQDLSLQKRLFSGLELDQSFSKINSTTFQEQQASPRNQSDIIQIKLLKPLDQKFLNFIREYGYIMGDLPHDNQSSFTVSTMERSRLLSNERQIVYSTSPPPSKTFRTKLFNHVN